MLTKILNTLGIASHSQILEQQAKVASILRMLENIHRSLEAHDDQYILQSKYNQQTLTGFTNVHKDLTAHKLSVEEQFVALTDMMVNGMITYGDPNEVKQ